MLPPLNILQLAAPLLSLSLSLSLFSLSLQSSLVVVVFLQMCVCQIIVSQKNTTFLCERPKGRTTLQRRTRLAWRRKGDGGDGGIRV